YPPSVGCIHPIPGVEGLSGGVLLLSHFIVNVNGFRLFHAHFLPHFCSRSPLIPRPKSPVSCPNSHAPPRFPPTFRAPESRARTADHVPQAIDPWVLAPL